MILIILIDFILIATLIYKASTKGVEEALPAFAFFVVLLPDVCQIRIPDLFALTAQRLAVLVLILCFLVFRGKRSNESVLTKTPLIYLIALHIIWCLISTANSIVPAMSIRKFFSVFFEYYAMYFIFYRSVSREETIERVVKGMIYGLAITTVFGVFESYTGWQITALFPDRINRFNMGMDEERGLRTQTTFPHSILYGGALAMAIPLTLYLISTAKSTKQKVIFWLIIMLMFLNLFKTSSRGPWLAAIFSFILVLGFAAKSVRKYMLAIAMLCVTVMIVRPGVYDTIKGFYVATFDPDSPMGSSYDYRYVLRDISQKALAKSFQRELWGYGLESFYYLHLTGPLNGNPFRPFESCDSAWIELTVETGYVGLVLIAAILFSSALRILRITFQLPPPHRFLCWTFFVNLIQYFFLMISVAIYAWGQNGYMLWMTIALGFAYSKSATKQSLAAQPIAEEQRALRPIRAITLS